MKNEKHEKNLSLRTGNVDGLLNDVIGHSVLRNRLDHLDSFFLNLRTWHTLLWNVFRGFNGFVHHAWNRNVNGLFNDLLFIPLLDLWGFNGFLDNIQLWDLNCLFRDMRLWNMLDLHNRAITHAVYTLQLWSLHGLLNSLVNGDLSLRHDRGKCHGHDGQDGSQPGLSLRSWWLPH